MGLFSFVGDILGVKDGKDNIKVNKQDIAWLADLFEERNRTNQSGVFGGWEWDGNTQRQTVAPGMQPSLDRFFGRQEQGPQGYDHAGQFSPLVDSLLADRMQGQRGPSAIPQRPEMRFSRDDVEGPPPGTREELRRRYG